MRAREGVHAGDIPETDILGGTLEHALKFQGIYSDTWPVACAGECGGIGVGLW